MCCVPINQQGPAEENRNVGKLIGIRVNEKQEIFYVILAGGIREEYVPASNGEEFFTFLDSNLNKKCTKVRCGICYRESWLIGEFLPEALITCGKCTAQLINDKKEPNYSTSFNLKALFDVSRLRLKL